MRVGELQESHCGLSKASVSVTEAPRTSRWALMQLGWDIWPRGALAVKQEREKQHWEYLEIFPRKSLKDGLSNDN